jgi:outer membrane biosynthesis protein TonB
MQAGEQASAEALLGAFKTIKAAERRKHASVLNYWLSIRGDKEFPPLHDLDPLELSDAGPNSALLELISGGHDAEIRHLGEALRGGQDWPERIMDAPNPSILACIAKKLPIVAISRDFLAFEDDFSDDGADTRIWVTLLPLSAGGAWVDYVYALVSLEGTSAKGAKAAEKPAKAQPKAEVVQEEPEETAIEVEETVAEVAAVEAPAAEADEPVEAVADEPKIEELEAEAPAAKPQKAAPGFSKLFDSLAGLTGFHAQSVKVEPVVAQPTAQEPIEDEPVEAVVAEDPPAEELVAEEPEAEEAAAEEPEAEAPVEPEPEPEPVEAAVEEEPIAAEQPPEAVEETQEAQPTEQAEQFSSEAEGPLQDKLTQVRARADEARLAKLRANSALYEGLSAAYDFALDAEDAPEEYLRLVEAQGLKIQLRSPMKPVVKLAFDGMCDDATIKQLEAVLAWAFDQELPRGELAEQIQSAGGISAVLNGAAKAA